MCSTSSDTDRSVQPRMMAKGLNFGFRNKRDFLPLGSETPRLRSAARFVFRTFEMQVFHNAPCSVKRLTMASQSLSMSGFITGTPFS